MKEQANHFKTAFDGGIFKDNHIKRALLYAFMKYRERGHKFTDLPWFTLSKDKG